jgi:Uma2 family endonuclease
MSASSPTTTTAPLRDGERLTRAEFLRRWEAQPDLKFAERIEGVVRLMMTPLHIRTHGSPSGYVGWCLVNYSMATPGTLYGSDSTIHVDGDNDFQPDHTLLIEPSLGGQARDEGETIAGAPELVVEVAASTAKRDLGVKKNVYRRAGVLEYLVWETKKKIIHVFLNRGGEFIPVELTSGVFKSQAFPGLWIDAAALIARDVEKLQKTAAAGLAHRSHAAFVKKLAAK